MFAMAHRRKCALWMKVSRLQSPYRHTTYGGQSRGILCRRQQDKSNLFFFLQIPHISEKELMKRSIDTFRKSEGDVLGNRETSALLSVLFPILSTPSGIFRISVVCFVDVHGVHDAQNISMKNIPEVNFMGGVDPFLEARQDNFQTCAVFR